MNEKQFEMSVKDIKTSVVKQDTCPMEGTLLHNGKDVKITMVASSDEEDVLYDLFVGVGAIITFKIVPNAQTALFGEEENFEATEDDEEIEVEIVEEKGSTTFGYDSLVEGVAE